ncbi:hypothetical protein [Parashewanella tropica]|uniref:hypothetical protein n=1 Tax=Parashewanella tropica TaxID=2547970 RepID=UPI00105A4B42|nr:hypothetical protein [Parashewanella tropica]
MVEQIPSVQVRVWYNTLTDSVALISKDNLKLIKDYLRSNGSCIQVNFQVHQAREDHTRQFLNFHLNVYRKNGQYKR